MKEITDFENFLNLDIRVGTIISAENFPEARNPAYILHIDFGGLGTLKSSAQITDLYKAKDLINQQVIAVVNFPKKQIGPIQSECLVLGIPDEQSNVVLLQPKQLVKNGLTIA